MNEEIARLKAQYLEIYTLSKEILAQSGYAKAVIDGWEYWRSLEWQRILVDDQNPRSLVSYIQNAIKNQLGDWEIYIDFWTELFWHNAAGLGIIHQRKDLLKKVLDKGRFSGVGEAMHTRYEWPRLLRSGLLQARYATNELDQVQEIIDKDEQRRLELLKKCLRLKRLASSDYLRYGDAIAYFTRGKLFNEPTSGTLLEQYFSKEEIVLLDELWK